jgi:uncharacterized protein (TIGR02996 family)
VTSDERGLLDGIRDDPYDDALRLVYADWLEDNGRADEAELIRVQIELAKEPRVKKGLQGRENALVRKLKATWPAGVAGAGVSYRRGLGFTEWNSIAGMTLGSGLLRDAGSPTWVVERELTLNGYGVRDTDFAALTRCKDFAQLTALEIERGEDFPPAAVVALAESPSATGLRRLKIERIKLGEKGAATLANLTGLRKLSLWWCSIGSKGVARLVNSKNLTELRELIFLGCAEDEASILAVSKAKGLPNLRSLYLTSNNVGDARLRTLLKSPLLPRLEELVLAGNTIRDNGAKALAECEALRNLKSLNLNGNQIREPGALALLESPCLTALEELDIQWQKISESTLGKLRKRFKKRKAK